MANADLQSLIEEHDISTDSLREDEESARTTFTISKDAETSLNWLAQFHQTTQKKVIDHVLEALVDLFNDDSLADAVESISPENTVRKAVAIDPGTRDGLNVLSEELAVPRDKLVEAGIRLARLLAEKLREKQKEEVEKVRNYFRDGDDLLEELTDPELQKGVGQAVSMLADIVGAAEDSLESETSIKVPF